jgi:hypothetical protein
MVNELTAKILHYLRGFYLFEKVTVFRAYLTISGVPFNFPEGVKSPIDLSIIWLAGALEEKNLAFRFEQLGAYLICSQLPNHHTVLDFEELLAEIKAQDV